MCSIASIDSLVSDSAFVCRSRLRRSDASWTSSPCLMVSCVAMVLPPIRLVAVFRLILHALRKGRFDGWPSLMV